MIKLFKKFFKKKKEDCDNFFIGAGQKKEIYCPYCAHTFDVSISADVNISFPVPFHTNGTFDSKKFSEHMWKNIKRAEVWD